jgi:hypothetical protein
MNDIGKILIIFGIVILAMGILFSFSNKIPLIGKMPGDILVKKDGFTFYFPLATSILISIILSLLFRLFNK